MGSGTHDVFDSAGFASIMSAALFGINAGCQEAFLVSDGIGIAVGKRTEYFEDVSVVPFPRAEHLPFMNQDSFGGILTYTS
jgi:hypothetical protein